MSPSHPRDAYFPELLSISPFQVLYKPWMNEDEIETDVLLIVATTRFFTPNLFQLYIFYTSCACGWGIYRFFDSKRLSTVSRKKFPDDYQESTRIIVKSFSSNISFLIIIEFFLALPSR